MASLQMTHTTGLILPNRHPKVVQYTMHVDKTAGMFNLLFINNTITKLYLGHWHYGNHTFLQVMTSSPCLNKLFYSICSFNVFLLLEYVITRDSLQYFVHNVLIHYTKHISVHMHRTHLTNDF